MGRYDVVISEVVVNELSKCREPKQTEMFAFLSEIEYTSVTVVGNLEVIALVDEIERLCILPPKCEADRAHIAAAIHSGCSTIVSWNFKHMVNVKVIDGVRMICLANHFGPIDIYTPTTLLERRLQDGQSEFWRG